MARAEAVAGDAQAIETLLLRIVPPAPPQAPVDADILDRAHRGARQWVSREAGALRPGSAGHKRAFCALLRETFNPYRPAIIDWPRLDPDQQQRLTSLPIWDIAVQTEGTARLNFAAYCESVEDDEVRDALLLNAWEEDRHKQVLSHLVRTYGIALAPEPRYGRPRDVERAFLLTGYSESIDSFFAFGLFDLARRSGFFPGELVETFEPVIQEECRHILLFANWLAWHRANLTWARRLRFEVRVAGVWCQIAWLRARMARTVGGGAKLDANFTMSSARSVTPTGIGLRDLVTLCLAENERRLAGYDTRLVRPTTVPAAARFLLAASKLWSRR